MTTCDQEKDKACTHKKPKPVNPKIKPLMKMYREGNLQGLELMIKSQALRKKKSQVTNDII